MACFVVPAAEAVVVTIANHLLKKEHAQTDTKVSLGHAEGAAAVAMSFVDKLTWLNTMLWGGSILLAFEHIWHGEVEPWFPFLTAARNPADTAVMLHEMATVGVTMAVLVTAVWVGMVLVTNAMQKKAPAAQPAVN